MGERQVVLNLQDPVAIGQAIENYKILQRCTVLEAADAVFVSIEQNRLAQCQPPGLRAPVPASGLSSESSRENASDTSYRRDVYPNEYME
jgi:hypothetical protein